MKPIQFTPTNFRSLALALLASGVAFISLDPVSGFAAEATLRETQQALKARGFYLGQPTGNSDEATRAALRRFQIREGLDVSGTADPATIAALQAPPNASAEADEADEAVPAKPSIRERAPSIVQSDREFLEEVETRPDPTELPAIGDGPLVEPPQRSLPEAEEQIAETTRTTKSVVRKAPRVQEAAPSREHAEEVEPPQPFGSISREEAREFVENSLAAAEGSSPEREVSFYADQVDYFGSGKVSRNFVARDQRRYYRRWPDRQFSLVGEPEVVRSNPSGASVRFRVKYSLGGGKETGRGQVESFVRLRQTEDGLKIATIRERKLD